ncbi:MAG: glutaredoxin family protein [Solirubrobacterales bacterium]
MAELSGDGPGMVRVFGRPDCHLCRIAEQEIASVLGPGSEVRVESIDIESDPELFRRLLERIPVVEVDGEVISELEFDEEAFRGALDLAPGSPGQ